MIKIHFKRKMRPSSFLWGLVVILSSIGLVSCDEIDIIGGRNVMYGSPTADFSISGKVKDEKGNGIIGIQTIVKAGYRNQPSAGYTPDDTDFHPVKIDTLYTDNGGKYNVESRTLPFNEVHILFSDVDGEANGSFASDSIVVDSKQIVKVKEGDKAWYDGAFKVETEIVLKEKKD